MSMVMRRTVLAVAALLGLGAAGEAAAQAAPDQLKTIRDRGTFRCGVYENVPGLSALDAQGNRVGFDVDYCRAMAAAENYNEGGAWPSTTSTAWHSQLQPEFPSGDKQRRQ